MGRKGRLLREAVAAGKLRTVAQERTALMHEVIRLASERLFFDPAQDEKQISAFQEDMAALICAVLPAALEKVGCRYFTTEELSKTEDWNLMGARIVQGIATRHERFMTPDRNGEYWRLRKGKQGRKRTGSWVLCLDCGVPRWTTPSRPPTQRCRDCWRAWRKKNRKEAMP